MTVKDNLSFHLYVVALGKNNYCQPCVLSTKFTESSYDVSKPLPCRLLVLLKIIMSITSTIYNRKSHVSWNYADVLWCYLFKKWHFPNVRKEKWYIALSLNRDFILCILWINYWFEFYMKHYFKCFFCKRGQFVIVSCINAVISF